jgi:hypothetical protein
LRNAHTVANAERYFRTSYLGTMSTWNIRDEEMADAVMALEDHPTAIPRFLLPLRDAGAPAAALSEPPRLQRAVGVVYLPQPSCRVTISGPGSASSSTRWCSSMRRAR